MTRPVGVARPAALSADSSDSSAGTPARPTPAAVAIAGIGTDLMKVERIARAHARHGQRFVHRILGEQERLVFARRHARDPDRGVRYLATRFAAKEAFSKAIGLGIRSPMRWTSVQALNAAGGKPELRLSGALAEWYGARFGAAHLSMTDESDLVAAFVVVETLPARRSVVGDSVESFHA